MKLNSDSGFIDEEVSFKISFFLFVEFYKEFLDFYFRAFEYY